MNQRPEPLSMEGKCLKSRLRACCLISILIGVYWHGVSYGSTNVVEVTDGIYVRFGLQQEPTTENQGRIANVGFILGRQRVAVIDTGNSLVEGLDLRAAIRRVTHLPIAYVIFTHMHPDHVLGAAAFVQDDPEFIGHVQLADALTRREPFYLEAARQLLGDDFEGTRVVLPGSPVSGSRKLDLGGRIIELEAHPTAHTNNDLTVYDPASGTLWLSDLLFIGRIPVIDGSILGWLRQMERLSARDIGLVVPGHGPVTHRWMDALAAQRRYLKKVVTGIREVIRNNGSITQAVSQVANGERENWLLFEENHGRNVTTSFVEIEWE